MLVPAEPGGIRRIAQPDGQPGADCTGAHSQRRCRRQRRLLRTRCLQGRPPPPAVTSPRHRSSPVPRSLLPAAQRRCPCRPPARRPIRTRCARRCRARTRCATLAWIFTPIFQTIFLTLTVFYQLLDDIGFAIIALTLIIRILLIPLFRQQIVSQRRMQMLQPEIQAIHDQVQGQPHQDQRRDRCSSTSERSVNPASGCLPALLQLFLLLPMYSGVQPGPGGARTSVSMLQVFGIPVLTVTVPATRAASLPCINPSIRWLRRHRRARARRPDLRAAAVLPAVRPQRAGDHPARRCS